MSGDLYSSVNQLRILNSMLHGMHFRQVKDLPSWYSVICGLCSRMEPMLWSPWYEGTHSVLPPLTTQYLLNTPAKVRFRTYEILQIWILYRGVPCALMNRVSFESN